MNLEEFAQTVATTLEEVAKVLKSLSHEIDAQGRLISALDTRLDRLEQGVGDSKGKGERQPNKPYACNACSSGGLHFHHPDCDGSQEYDPNAAAESRHGEGR